MKLTASIIKSLKENIRDWKVILLVLAFSPFFVLITSLFYGGEATTYTIGIINRDMGSESIKLVKELKNTNGQDNSQIFKIIDFNDTKKMEEAVKNKSIDLGMIIPEDYSKKLQISRSGKVDNPAVVDIYGSLGNMKYTVAAVLSSNQVYKQGMEAAQIVLPSEISETFLEKKLPKNEFESYAPGMISLSVLMLLFTACASIVKENEKRTLVRLKLSRMGAFNFLSGISIVQAVIAIIAIIISYWAALALGYKPVGNFGPVVVIGILSSFSMVAVSLVVASFLNTIFDVMTVGCFPFFIMMFFSGSMLPLPKVNLFTIGGHSFGFTDILPLTHTASAFNKILNYGAKITGVGFEIAMICLLSVIYFAAGMVLYQRRKLSKA